MPEAAENWATEQFPPDQRENLAGNTIWHWMVEGYRAGLAASPSEELREAAILLAEVEWRGAFDEYDTICCPICGEMDELPYEFNKTGTEASHRSDCRLAALLAALRTTKEGEG